MKISPLLFLVPTLASSLLGISANAAEVSQTDMSVTDPNAWDRAPWRLYGGASEGYGSVSGSEFGSAPNGSQTMIDADLSFYLTGWVLDAGAGWMYSRLDGTHSNSSSISIRTRAGFGDASVRYRFNEHWQFGPAYDIAFGTDTGFGPGVSNSVGTSLLGARLVYEFGLANLPFRIIGQGLTAIDDPGRNYVVATLGFQVGLPFGGRSHEEVAEKPIVSNQAAAIAAPEEVRITLDPRKVFFSTNSARLVPGVQKALHDIGDYLASNQTGWTHVTLGGYADQRGTAGYNLKLSERRADAVRSTLVQSGTSKDKVEVDAYGLTHPADPQNNPVAWAKNRRVELVFQGVSDPQGLRNKIQELTQYQSEDSQ